MGTQKGGYFLKSGERCPSVTTIIGRFKNADPLMWWAWNEGKNGRDYRETRDKAADAGTMAHEAVERWIHKQPISFEGDPDVCKKAKTAFEAFLAWADQSQLVVTETEIPMISETHRYGGTADGFTIRGKRAVLDWKSSGGIYPDYLVQVAAYGALWNETHPDDPVIAGYHLVRFDKTYGDFHHHHWAELEAGWKAFLHLRELYEIEKELRARAK